MNDETRHDPTTPPPLSLVETPAEGEAESSSEASVLSWDATFQAIRYCHWLMGLVPRRFSAEATPEQVAEAIRLQVVGEFLLWGGLLCSTLQVWLPQLQAALHAAQAAPVVPVVPESE